MAAAELEGRVRCVAESASQAPTGTAAFLMLPDEAWRHSGRLVGVLSLAGDTFLRSELQERAIIGDAPCIRQWVASDFQARRFSASAQAYARTSAHTVHIDKPHSV
eukprot:TRINITY_DN3019_c0_g2_i3.p2 TRINITY_DN3019_c0_g2~~TRINITY_DN3019_c0_g2_i3.p2  ORF type:complete len:106 (-),score=12.82 TRINITY_DN3019_c0_g2_i3:537-854(-)